MRFHYDYDRDTCWSYERFWRILKEGNPIAVNYKTGSKSGHFAVVIGMEQVPEYNRMRRWYSYHDINNDRVILANGPDMTWSEFVDRWQRKYCVGSKPVLELKGEHQYTHIFLRHKDAKDPSMSAHGKSGDDQPPRHLKWGPKVSHLSYRFSGQI